ncbi:sensor histidine kinase [Marixanthomonas sp. SCSIO 43207]|uniref:tetratricopeptide repeat-containing sensor histidine kinase n=1 Tax=Marixanthomonas sp. SCSIO 43207 TaxID=2779360 RepID=UPI001CA8D8DA|nr:sensor histidine kinase [Marixanthomonas sp. SCSIO 43207]UAB81762.1 sensor histidine kinase [Marixanthomonas sp. SCSIO 43207]
MKQLLLSLFCLFVFSMYAQENEQHIIELKQKINSSEKGEKLRWMDSLTDYIFYSTQRNPDSILQATISYAIQLDSMHIAIDQLSNRMDYLNNTMGNPEDALVAYEKIRPKISEVKDETILTRLYLNIGDSHFFTKEYEKAIAYYDTTIAFAKKANKQRLLGLATMYKAGTQSQIGDFAKSSQGLQESIKLFKKSKDTFNIISANNSLSILYSQNGFYKEAAQVRKEGIALAKNINSNAHLVTFYMNAATDDNKQNRPKERIQNLLLAKEASDNSGHDAFYNPILYSHLSIAYSETDSLELARKYLSKLEKLTIQDSEHHRLGGYYSALKHFWFAKKEYPKALQYAKEHLAVTKKSSDYEGIMNAEKFLAAIYDVTNNEAEAYKHFKAYEAIKDSISNVQKVNALSYYQTLYETEKRDAKIEMQQSDIALLDAENRLKNQWLLFGGLGMLGLFGAVVLTRSRFAAKKRQKLQERFSQDLIKAQEDERTRVARELHDSVGQKLMLLTKKTKTIGDRDMESLAGTTLEELRSISRGLHPATLEKLGVTKAIETMINEVDANTNIFFTNEIENIDSDLTPDQALHLYRIIQEVLNNMVKHAQAKAASVQISKKGKVIEALIKDNGDGFEYNEQLNNSESLGMKTLLERAKIIHSKLSIETAHLKGTSILLQIPT